MSIKKIKKTILVSSMWIALLMTIAIMFVACSSDTTSPDEVSTPAKSEDKHDDHNDHDEDDHDDHDEDDHDDHDKDDHDDHDEDDHDDHDKDDHDEDDHDDD